MYSADAIHLELPAMHYNATTGRYEATFSISGAVRGMDVPVCFMLTDADNDRPTDQATTYYGNGQYWINPPIPGVDSLYHMDVVGNDTMFLR